MVVFTIFNSDQVWSNTFDYIISITPKKHPDSIVIAAEYIADELNGVGEIKFNEIYIDGKEAEFSLLKSGQGKFRVNGQYKLDLLYIKILIPYKDGYLNKPVRIKGIVEYRPSQANKSIFRQVNIETKIKEYRNRWIFGRIKYPDK